MGNTPLPLPATPLHLFELAWPIDIAQCSGTHWEALVNAFAQWDTNNNKQRRQTECECQIRVQLEAQHGQPK